MTTIDEANALLSSLNATNQKITQLEIRKQEKEKLITEVLARVQVKDYTELEAKIAACQQQLDAYYAQAKQEYDTVLPKVQEAEACLQS